MKSITTNNRVKIVDFLRTISILAVLANHFFCIDFSQKAGPEGSVEEFLHNIIWRFALSGAYGVSIFFVLSGFLITRMTAERNYDLFLVNKREFYIRRIGRILPLLLLVLGIFISINIVYASIPVSSLPSLYIFALHLDPARFDLAFFFCLITLSLNWLFIFTVREYPLQLSVSGELKSR
jgi:peptidoglycan/LPS O-acetylase OafA/YrhL